MNDPAERHVPPGLPRGLPPSRPPRLVGARRATPEDAEEVVRLRTVMLDALGRGRDRSWHPYAVADLRERLAEPDGDLAVFVVDRPVRAAAPAAGGRGGADPDDGTAPGDGRARGDGTASGAALAACAAGTVERLLPGPGSPLGLTGHVFNVATDPDMRRRGCSRACMTALLEWYRERGVRKIDLHTSADAEPLYTSLGFVRHTAPAMRLTY